jgi:hypothetical protein
MGTSRTDFVEHDNHWKLRLEGWTVDRCAVDHELHLQFFNPPGEASQIQPGYEVSLGDYVYTSPDGSRHLVDGEAKPSAFGPALDLFKQEIERATIWKSGRLQLSFKGGHLVDVEPSEQYEAWQITGPDGLLVVCVPGGGEPAVWFDG